MVYDANGNITENNFYNWDSDTNGWVLDGRRISAYDSNENRTGVIDYRWDSETNDWVGMYSWVYTYDANGNQTEEIRYFWDPKTNNWVYHSNTVRYWSELTTSISNNTIDLNYIVYPNPTQGILTIETDIIGQYSIVITSINGQLLYNSRIEGTTHQIDLSSFEKGLYFITVRSKYFVRTEKIIKQ